MPWKDKELFTEILVVWLDQWFLTGVRSNPKGSTKLFQGFGGRYPIFGHIINKYLLKISKLKS